MGFWDFVGGTNAGLQVLGVISSAFAFFGIIVGCLCLSDPLVANDEDRAFVRWSIGQWLLLVAVPYVVAWQISEGRGMWVAITFGVVAFFGLSALKIWTSHRERMAKMEQDAKIAMDGCN